MNVSTVLFALALTGGFTATATAEETVKEVVKDVKAGAKKAVRSAKDEACPLVDGKVVCAGKKLKHKAQNAADDAQK